MRPVIGNKDTSLEDILASQSPFQTRGPSGEGILPAQEIREFIKNGIIRSPRELTDLQVQPASIDLRLSSEVYRVRASFLPGKTTTLINKATSNGMLSQRLDISEPTLLEPGVIYIIPLLESVALPSDIWGIANPKSTTGRLDIFTRLITEHGEEFDRIERGYRGNLYIEVLSQTFPIIVQAGMTLNQLRFGRGRHLVAGDAQLRMLDQEDLLIGPDDEGAQTNINRGVRITVDLQGDGSNIVGYKAKKFSPPINLANVNYYDRPDFWDPILRDEKSQLILEPGGFYILVSKQRVRVPADFAAELLPYDLATQEFRVHYAGFFDPGFGYGLKGEIPGTKAVLEVRASQVPILLEDDQYVGRLNYFKMAGTPDKIYGGSIGSSYQQQGLALAKQFKREEQYISRTSNVPISGAKLDIGGTKSQAEIDEEDEKSSPSLNFPGGPVEQWITAKNR